MTDEQHSLSELTQTFRTTMLLIARSIDAIPTPFQSELDIIEMLHLTRSVIAQRLSGDAVYHKGILLKEEGHFEERKKDKKRNYVLLFDSIRQDVVETIRTSFTGQDGRARGPVIQKYNTLAMDALFAVLQRIGPEESPDVLITLIDEATNDMLQLNIVDPVDSTIAAGVLAKMSKNRAQRMRKPLTKPQRMAAIAKAAKMLNIA